MITKKTLINLLFTSCMLSAVCCTGHTIESSAASTSLARLPEGYMYTLTIPEIMEISIAQEVSRNEWQ